MRLNILLSIRSLTIINKVLAADNKIKQNLLKL